MHPLPETIAGAGFLMRRWRTTDLDGLHRAISDSTEHLTPWLRFMQKPQTREAHRQKIASWIQAWELGGDAEYGVFVHGEVVGAVSLLRRRGPGVLEIGYWIHVAWLRRGLALEAARLLTDRAFASPPTVAVEIVHDRANVASEGIPRRLGFRVTEDVPSDPCAPLETGMDRVWRLTREEWEQRGPGDFDGSSRCVGP